MCGLQFQRSIASIHSTSLDTMIGQIAQLASQTGTESSSLQKEIRYAVKLITIFGLIQGIAFFVISVSRGNNVLNSFINTFIVVLVANVPQG